jgi:hypothetical protein
VYANEGMAYVFGGGTVAGVTTSIMFAPILPSGRIGEWSYASATTKSNVGAYMGSIAYNGYAYMVAGQNTGLSRTNVVQYTPLTSRNIYWGVTAPANAVVGNYTSSITYTMVYSP